MVDGHVDLILVDARSWFCPNLAPQRDDPRVGDHLVRIFVLAAARVHDRGGAGMIDRELALEPGARLGLAGQLEHERMHFSAIEAMSVALRPCALRSWMQPSMAGWMTMPQANGL